MDLGQTQFLAKAVAAATEAHHVWPKMAACEAALESAWGKSALAIQANNLFGMKAHENATNVIEIPTREWVDTVGWQTFPAKWMKYTSWLACFDDRMATLELLEHAFPDYGRALDAVSAQEYIFYVSKSWSTDPDRAAKVLRIYLEAYS